ncbi:HAD-IB family hydrolase [bacterium]|nr:HAD-IB family hydrolase [bacterium]
MTDIAFFDFDGTVTGKDSFPDFIKYSVGKKNYYSGLILLTPVLAAYKLKIIPNFIAKEKLIAYFFKNWEIDYLQNIANQYSINEIDKIVNSRAIEKIKWHKQKNHKVVIVSASLECYLKAWCSKNDIDLISTMLEVKKNRITGKLAGKNCYGNEKLNRIKEKYNLSEYNSIYVYGDSKGDKQMLDIADKKYFRAF